MKRNAPRIKNGFPTFQLSRLVVYKDGSRRTRVPSLKGNFCLQIMGTKKDYQKLAKMILRFSIENAHDSEHHRHVDNILSHDGTVRVDLVVRKDDVGTALWRMELIDDHISGNSPVKSNQQRKKRK